MRFFLYLVLTTLIILNLYFATYAFRQGEVNFFNDVARDFLLLREIDEKKIVFIGPRSNTPGLFHGPLWSYINYPAYLLGSGDPLFVELFWILLAIGSVGVGYWWVKKTLGILPALAFVLLLSASLMTHVSGMFHSESTILMTFVLFTSLYLYAQKVKVIYLVFHLILLAMMIQLNVGVGIPLAVLSLILIIFLTIKRRTFKHLFVLLIVPLFLANMIIFDIRHGFLMSKAMLSFYETQKTWNPFPLSFILLNRFNETVNLRITLNQNQLLHGAVFSLLLFFTIWEIARKSKFRLFYTIILYYYLGYMLLTFTNKGVILFHFVYFLSPLTILWFVSFLRGNYRYIFLPLLLVLATLNAWEGFKYLNYLHSSFIGKTSSSWQATNRVAQSIIARRKDGKPFGYFVFSPDAFAYGPRYAMMYHFEKSKLPAYEYTKKGTTYIIAAPPPDNDPYMTYVWWRKNAVKITTTPAWVATFPGGYTVEEYTLSESEQQISHDKTIELGIHFR